MALYPYGALPDDTGEFMLGEVAVTVVLMESDSSAAPPGVTPDPNTETWTAPTIAAVKSKVESAMQWWKETLTGISPSMANTLSFTFDYTYADSPVRTFMEPINRRSNDFQLWMYDFLKVVGYDDTRDFSRDIRAYNDAKRRESGAQWAFTIFVVNSTNDSDDSFASGGSFSRAFDNWSEMEKTWRRAAEVDGAGFVPRIFHAANPFGDTVHFVTHYSGWLRTRGMKDVYLYTQSSDASFVVVNNRFELDWAGLHDGRANQKTVPGQLVRLAGDLTKIDYFHVKADPDHPPGMVLAGSGARSMRRSRRTRGCARNQRRSSAWRARAAGQCRWDGSSSVPTLDLKTSSSSRRAARCRTATRRVGR